MAVSLTNDRAETWRHDVYGDVITIERKINSNSGGAPFTLRDARGNKVAAGRSEIDAVLEHFSVDVSNPVTVMTQDLSRSFLHSGKDEDKYRFFMQATLLENVRTQLLYAEENVGEMERQVKEKQKELPAKELAVQKLKEQLTEAQAIGQLRQQEEVVTWKIAWHNVFVKRQDVAKYEGMLSTVRAPARTIM